MSFIILRDRGSVVRHVSLSKGSLFLIGCATAILLSLVVLGIVDYISLKNQRTQVSTLVQEVSRQRDRIASDAKQIKYFSTEINELKSKLVELHHFEQKVKQVVGIEKTEETDPIFGLGGPAPEDIKPEFRLSGRHDSLFREMRHQVDTLNSASVKRIEEFESLLAHLDEQRNILASTPAVWPVKGWVSSGFGYRKSPITGLRDFHKGLDIAAPKGTHIRAPANGIVTFVGRKGAMGKMIVIDHGHGMITRYGHIHKSLKKRGDTVQRGDQIALIGRTGRTTGSHVHYEVLLNGMPVNPKKYILN